MKITYRYLWYELPLNDTIVTTSFAYYQMCRKSTFSICNCFNFSELFTDSLPLFQLRLHPNITFQLFHISKNLRSSFVRAFVCSKKFKFPSQFKITQRIQAKIEFVCDEPCFFITKKSQPSRHKQQRKKVLADLR